MNRWLVETATGRFLSGGSVDPVVSDSATQAIVDLPSDRMPDPQRERYDANASSGIRPATLQELQSTSLALADSVADTESRNKNTLAVLGTMLEKFDPAWAGMTDAQKKAAVNEMATLFAKNRRWVERKL
jgi:hypothetical protein